MEDQVSQLIRERYWRRELNQPCLIPAHTPELILQIKNHQDEVNQEDRSFSLSLYSTSDVGETRSAIGGISTISNHRWTSLM